MKFECGQYVKTSYLGFSSVQFLRGSTKLGDSILYFLKRSVRVGDHEDDGIRK